MGREQVPYIMRKHATCGNKMKKEVGWKRTVPYIMRAKEIKIADMTEKVVLPLR
jgi:hypothetical protein